MTELAYITEPEAVEIDSNVLAVEGTQGDMAIVLDRTPFYPQGGGQPSDVGVINGDGFTFTVRKAVLIDGVVHHQGVAAGTPRTGSVHAQIDAALRALHARLHSGGHLLMTAMYELRGQRAIKGYHFPAGAYVEFEGTVPEEERLSLVEALQQRLDEMIAEDAEIIVESTTVGELKAAGVYMPMEIPVDKPTRVVTSFGFRSPCGGTHVAHSGDLHGLRVRGLKSKSGNTRVSYEFAAE